MEANELNQSGKEFKNAAKAATVIFLEKMLVQNYKTLDRIHDLHPTMFRNHKMCSCEIRCKSTFK